MDIQSILAGPAADRPNGSAHLMTEAEARGVLLEIEAHMPRKRRGPAVRKLAEAPVGRLSVEAKALYRAYAAAYGA